MIVVTKYKLVFFLSFFFYFTNINSQTKKDDAYYILNTKHKDYVLKSEGISLDEFLKESKYISKISGFRFYNRKEYEKREKQINKDKKENKYNEFYGLFNTYPRPKEITFSKVYGSKVEIINNFDIESDSLNLVSYKWIKDNTWKENNPNILFKDLYFLFEVEQYKYLKFKVVRTVIAH